MGAPDLLGRDFTATEPNKRWCGDITYVRTWDGWAYLATVIDLHSRMVVGWAVADHMRTELVTDALQIAVAHRRPPAGVIFHSDRGTQGGLKWSSQHLDDGGGLWVLESVRSGCGSIGARWCPRLACRGRSGSASSATLAE